MSNNFWDTDDNEDFADRPLEYDAKAQGKWKDAEPGSAPRSANLPVRPQAKKSVAPPPTVQETIEEAAEQMELEDQQEEDDFTAVLSDANLRLEQGQLYKIIMNHDLFDGTDADPIAIRNVQKEIRRFAKERMEVMLGMRQLEVPTQSLSQDFPFNSLEVEALKALASAATQGATKNEEVAPYQAPEVPKAKVKTTLNPIGGSSKKSLAPKPAAPKKPLPASAAAPVSRKKISPTVAQILAEEGLSAEDVELDYEPLTKPIENMTEAEILERNRKASARRKGKQSVKSMMAAPSPTQDQINQMYTQKAMQAEANPQMSLIMRALENSRK